MTWGNSETLSTVLHFDPVHFRISGKNNPENKIHLLHLIFQRMTISDVRVNYLVIFRINFRSTDDGADLCLLSFPLRNIGQDTDCPNGEYLCL